MDYLLKLGSIFVLSIFFGEIASRLKLPRLIGYLSGGFLLGPSTLNFLDRDFLDSSQFLKEFSLAFILLVIGAKIKGERLKNIGKGLPWVALYEITITISLISIAFFIFMGNILYALLIGIVAAATAPAATAMITEEYHSEGPFTDSILFTVGLDNLTVLILFDLLAPIMLQVAGVSYLIGAFVGVLLSIAIGALMGICVSYIESRIAEKRDNIFFLVGFGFFFMGLGLTNLIKGYPFVYALFMGIVLSNSSIKNCITLNELFYIKTPIYIFFFFVAGASLHIETILEMKWAVIIYVLVRAIGKLSGAYLGAKKGGLDETFRRHMGPGLLTNAGLATGLAIYIGDNGGETGHKIMNIILSGTVVFEILGPLLLKQSLVKAGEVKVIQIMKKGMEPILDRDFQSVLYEFTRSFGLKRLLREKISETTKVKHVMRKNFVFLNPGDHIQEIVEGFEKAHFNALPVVSSNNVFHGMIELKELEHLFLDEVTKKLILAEDLVTTSPKLSPGDDLLTALKIMRKNNAECLPVVENNTLLGIVTRTDIVTGIA